ncbi:hypothetical protein KUTeg_017003 [Tegillarca granosa]|uniref:TIR domain-containing protein n=1 Tax=Tegillarca granosa TaxID=220873 RepID=A0ABQ9EMJ4_TEGGR|nr:hypothetical protein KUTeg_017003 [Tegillarca granosa]
MSLVLKEKDFDASTMESLRNPYLNLLSFGKSYHVYFIYHNQASDWVHDTVQRFETLGYICSYRERDFIPGRTKTSNIIFALENSIKFVVVITKSFLLCTFCQYELDLALNECMKRTSEICDLIPVIIEECDIPSKLEMISPLEVYLHKDTWWRKLVQALNVDSSVSLVNPDSSSNSLVMTAEAFQRKLMCSNIDEIMSFLCRPIAMELTHFLNQQCDLRMFISAMESCGVYFDGDVVRVRLSIFQRHLQQEHNVAQCFSEHVQKLNTNVNKICLLIKDETEVIDRQNSKIFEQFTEFVKVILKIPENKFWGIMWSMKGVQMTRRLRDECRGLINDAVNEHEITEIAHPEMSSLHSRLDTFKKWSQDKIPKPIHIAEAGYFLEGPNDVLRCFYCNCATWDLKPHDDPWKRHAKWAFYCPYVKQQKDDEYINTSRFSKKDELKVYNALYSSLDTRVNSYMAWNCENGPDPRLMAKAGFYFTKFEDKVVCFACGYGVRNWQYNDDPWYKHAWWSPFCKYVRRNKGQRFIDNVQEDRMVQGTVFGMFKRTVIDVFQLTVFSLLPGTVFGIFSCTLSRMFQEIVIATYLLTADNVLYFVYTKEKKLLMSPNDRYTLQVQMIANWNTHDKSQCHVRTSFRFDFKQELTN